MRYQFVLKEAIETLPTKIMESVEGTNMVQWVDAPPTRDQITAAIVNG